MEQNKKERRGGKGAGEREKQANLNIILFLYAIVNSQVNHKVMEGENKNQNGNIGRKPNKKVNLDSDESQRQEQKLNSNNDQQGQGSESSDSSSGWSSEVIEPAIKSMAFRSRRGTRMKDLIKGKHRKDQFWQKYQDYFGGDLDKPEDSQDEEDYQASSSGRDQFDSDFDLTDSYVGKRGRKKGTKIRKRRRAQPKKSEEGEEGPSAPKGRRGRKKKVPADSLPQQKSELLLKAESGINQQKELYVPECRSDDVFLIIKKARKNTRQPRSKKTQERNSRSKLATKSEPMQVKHQVKPSTLEPRHQRDDICEQYMAQEPQQLQ